MSQFDNLVITDHQCQQSRQRSNVTGLELAHYRKQSQMPRCAQLWWWRQCQWGWQWWWWWRLWRSWRCYYLQGSCFATSRKNTEPPYQNIQSTKMYPNIFNEICHPLNLKKDLCRKICFITIVVTYKLAELFYMGASLSTNWRGFSQCKKRRGDPIRGGATAGQTGFSS